MAEVPKVTVIIPSKPGDSLSNPLEALGHCGYPTDRLEILHATGFHPSVQRNQAAREATGDVLYFLDSDAAPAVPSDAFPDGTLRHLTGFFSDRMDTASHPARLPHPPRMAGGPSWTPPTDSRFQQAAGWMFSSFFGGGAIRSRYASIGSTRPAGQHELILCNLMMDRQAFLDLGGFNERLYPNEENDLIVRFLRSGGQAFYVPEAGIWRSQRSTPWKFLTQVFTYGRGRAEQTKVLPSSLSPMAPVAAGIALYLILLPVWLTAGWLTAGRFGVAALLFPGALYGMTIFLASLLIGIRSRSHDMVWRTLPLFILGHAGYGAGFLAGLSGLAHGKKPVSTESVRIERVHLERSISISSDPAPRKQRSDNNIKDGDAQTPTSCFSG